MAAETHPRSVGAIVVGAGSGRRLGGVEKAFLPVLGRPLLAYSVDALQASSDVAAICIVLAAASVARGLALVREQGWSKVTAVVAGGAERQDSVRAGLNALPPCEWVLVHDAARPLLSPEIIGRGLRAARSTGAAVAAMPVRDTLKRVRGGPGRLVVAETVPRSDLWAAQTPQVFRSTLLRRAFDAAGDGIGAFTDDASLVEALGHDVRVFEGASTNVKVTLPEDIALVEALLRTRAAAAPLCF